MSRTAPFFLRLIVSRALIHLTAADSAARPFDPPADPASAPIDDASGGGGHSADEGEENPDEWEIDPYSAPDQGPVLTMGSEVDGTLGPQGASFVFHLDRTRAVRLSTAGPTDTLGTLLDDESRVLATDDDSGPAENFHIEVDLAPGWYVLRLEGSWGSQGPYTLSLSEGR